MLCPLLPKVVMHMSSAPEHPQAIITSCNCHGNRWGIKEIFIILHFQIMVPVWCCNELLWLYELSPNLVNMYIRGYNM